MNAKDLLITQETILNVYTIDIYLHLYININISNGKESENIYITESLAVYLKLTQYCKFFFVFLGPYLRHVEVPC